MGDSARCLCPKDSISGKCCGRNPGCPFHGDSGKDPAKPYTVTFTDKRFLSALRIATADSAEIQAVREDEEKRRR